MPTQLKPGWTIESKQDMATSESAQAMTQKRISPSSSSPMAANRELLQKTILDWRMTQLKGPKTFTESLMAEPPKEVSPKREKQEISWDQVVVGCRVHLSSGNGSGIVVRKATYHSVENIVDEVGDLPADFKQTTSEFRFAWIIMEGRFENYKLIELSEFWGLEAMSHEMLLTHENSYIRAFGRSLLNKSGEEVLQQWVESGRYNDSDSEKLFEADLRMTFPSESTDHNIALAKEIGRTPDKKRLLEIFIKLQNAYAHYTK